MEQTTSMDDIIGRTISRLFVGPGEECLVFDTDAGLIAFETFADCCSETWFADIVGVDALLGGTVTAVVTRELPDPDDDRSRQDVDSAYGFGLITNKGVCDVIFRNSSNGYYGGWLDQSDTAPSLDGFKEITADWSA